MNSAVDQAVKCIWERYSDPLSLAEMARSAMLSRFHFARVFKDQTGVSPGQFLAAVRIYQAKRLLLISSMSVAGVSSAVGYGSLGSFTSHFTDSVGISPSRFRRASQSDASHSDASQSDASRNHAYDGNAPYLGGVSACGLPPDSPVPAGAMTGTVRLPEGYAGARVYLGVFDTRILQHRPQSAAMLDVTSQRSHPYWLPDVPDGRWFLHMVAVADTDEPEPWTQRHLLVGGGGQVRGTLGAVTLRPRTLTDLPVLLALPDLEAELDGLAHSVEHAAGW
ncbi:MAG: AraC family transcriptional regulator [Actinomycetota bacterium]|nr:AraC family transcriptional regulator [Actinomycetota bacterium]